MNATINNSRLNFEKLGTRYRNAENIIIEKEIIENINCYWFYKKEMTEGDRIIIYLHGGCFVLGSIRSHRSLVSHLSNELNTPILFIEYSLAPENPFPAAIKDIVQVYQYVLHRKQIKDIVMVGDSAGAGLAVSVISRLDKEYISRPGHLVMLSPWVDLRCSNNSILKNAATDPVLTKEQLQAFTLMYIGSNKLSDTNPIEIVVAEFPPTLIVVGSGEILLDDSNLIYNKIASQQAKTKLSIYDKQDHVWMLENIHTEPSKTAMKEIREFIAV